MLLVLIHRHDSSSRLLINALIYLATKEDSSCAVLCFIFSTLSEHRTSLTYDLGPYAFIKVENQYESFIDLDSLLIFNMNQIIKE